MKYPLLYRAIAGSLIVLLSAACSPKLKPLPQGAVTVNPAPMERIGSAVPAQITLRFPAKWLPKNTKLTVTPVLTYSGGNETAPDFLFQGSSVRDNNTVISYSEGGTEQLNVSFPYNSKMRQSALYLYMSYQNGSSKVRTLAPIEVAQGVVTTQEWASAAGCAPIYAPDGFSRIVTETYSTDIKFLIQQAEVRASELKKQEVKEWKDAVENAEQVPNQKVDIEVQAYASPDGGVTLNEKLSQKREQNTTRTLQKEFAGYDIPVSAHYTAQDWEGFKTLLEQSNIQDKELVLRVLSMYTDPEEREEQIKNLSFVFGQLAKEILPELRRSRLTANISIIGKSDEELLALAQSHPGRLKADEMLYTATLLSDAKAQESLYRTAMQVYPKDYRAFNNLGTLLLSQGKAQEAADLYTQAAQLQSNAYTSLNAALLALDANDLEKARLLIGTATDLPEADRVLGLLYLKEGKPEEAARLLATTPSVNTAVAQILAHRYADALQTLRALPEPTALNYYLRAVVAARTNSVEEVVSNLEQATQMDPTLARTAGTDLEFASVKEHPQVARLLR